VKKGDVVSAVEDFVDAGPGWRSRMWRSLF
jgi:hypothetical protein